MHKITKIFLSFLVVGLLSFLALYRTDWFTLSKTSSLWENRPEWNPQKTFVMNDEYRSILSQPFYYLGKGRQSFVFESKDKKYVLKLFNHYRYHYPRLLEEFPLPAFLRQIRKEKIFKKRAKLAYYFGSYRLAFDKLKEESALVIVHLNQTNKVFPVVTIHNRCLHPFLVSLDEVAFVLQRKATAIYPKMQNLLEKGEGVKGIDAFLDTVFARVEKNISDGDIAIGINYGFLDDRVVCFDVGRLYENKNLQNKECFLQEVLRSTRQMGQWLSAHYPQEKKYFHREIKKRTELYFSKGQSTTHD